MPLRLLALALLAATGLRAQTAIEMNLGMKVLSDDSTSPPTYTVSWWGTSGMHYLVEASPDLSTWTFLSGINPSGADAALSVIYETNADRYFFRVLQFDPDDPNGFDDLDADGLPDRWEQHYFGTLERDGSGDWNEDGLLDRDAFRFGLNPKGSDESEVTGKFDSFDYDARGWLDTVTLTGSAPVSFGLDDEGNIETAN
jgi:hypothetical protein